MREKESDKKATISLFFGIGFYKKVTYIPYLPVTFNPIKGSPNNPF